MATNDPDPSPTILVTGESGKDQLLYVAGSGATEPLDLRRILRRPPDIAHGSAATPLLSLGGFRQRRQRPRLQLPRPRAGAESSPAAGSLIIAGTSSAGCRTNAESAHRLILDRFWRRFAPGVEEATFNAQLICFPTYLHVTVNSLMTWRGPGKVSHAPPCSSL